MDADKTRNDLPWFGFLACREVLATASSRGCFWTPEHSRSIPVQACPTFPQVICVHPRSSAVEKSRPGLQAFEKPVGQRARFEVVEDGGGEAVLEQRGGLSLAQPARAQVEAGVVVELADRRAVTGGDVLGVDF